MRQIRGNSRGGDPEAEIQRQFKDTIVMTSYNRKTYHIKDIDFKASPLDTFETKKGKVSYADYYRERYNKEVKDLKQPLIRCEPSKKDKHMGHTGDVVLVPELCQLTGLTDQMRENFTLMKELSKHLHMGPQDRVKEINRFMDRLYLKQEVST
jgi:aubergine-like protein